ncbi:MAG TPA: 6-bladed beta-propeller [Acetobacteraceae bacterium]|nr:6-bladed beta-propeller [Acetobacteraceae bacterium]
MSGSHHETCTIGTGAYCYSFERDWAKLPRGWSFSSPTREGRPPSTCVRGAATANGDVLVLARSAHPVMVFDAEGRFVTSWGEGCFSSFVHGLSVDAAGHVWIADSGRHEVTEHAADGTLIRTLGDREVPAPTFYGRPFNMPTGVAFASDGDMYVSDGYGNRRVHRFAADGTLKHSWGEPGSGPGQFALVHFIAIDDRDQIYIADRENDRIQLFARDGEFLAAWTDFRQPSDLAFGREAIYVGAQDGLSIWTKQRKPIVRWDRNDPYEGAFSIHGIWIDAAENIYLAHFDRAVSKLTRLG